MDEYKTDYLEAAAEEAERFRKAAMILAERAGISAEEALYRVQEAVQAEPKHRRRKRQRERAALIERRYMVQIRHYERAHPFRRVYKPP